MKLYFVRHGESEANILHVISNRESPFGLTALGKEQAGILANTLQNIPITAIFSSPILRARETAEIVSQSLYQSYQLTEALREYDCGVLEEKADKVSWTQHREIYEDWTLHHNIQRKPDGGESFLDIQNRFLPFIQMMVDNNSHTNNHILFISHGGLLQLMLPLVLTNIDNAFVSSHGIGHTECIIVEQGSGGLVCMQWGQVLLTDT